MWKKPWFLSQGSRVESFMSSQDRCLSHGLGSNLRGTLESRSVEGPSSLMAHQPSGDVGCISCSQKFLADLRGYHVLVHADNTLVVSYIITRGVCGHVHLQTGMPNPPVVPREVVVSSSCLHPGGPQYRSRHPVKIGAEARGMEAPPQGGGADMEAQVDLFAPRETSHCPLWFSLMHPAPLKNRLDAIVQTWPRLCLCAFSQIALLPREFAGNGFYYFSLPLSGRAEYGSQIYIPS